MATRRPTGTNDASDEATPVLGLTKAQLHPIVEALAGESVASFEIEIKHQVIGHYGYGGEKLIPTFAYVTRSGRQGETPVFVKAMEDDGACEVYHYRELAKLNAPIPTFYGSMACPRGTELIFLEYLEPTATVDTHPFDKFVTEEESFRQFLCLAARYNALEPRGDYARSLDVRKPIDKKWTRGVADALDCLWACARRGELGERLGRLCTDCPEGPSVLKAMAEGLVGASREMPLGLLHADYFPDSAGWRTEPRELLMLDLESVCLGPRFFDVARWLGPPSAVRQRRPSAEHARMYLERYAEAGGPKVSLQTFQAEVAVLSRQQALDLGWTLRRALDGLSDWTEDRDEARQVWRADLYRFLLALLKDAGADVQTER